MKGIKMDVPYFQVPNTVFEVGLNKHELLVYFYLARCGNQGATAFPSYNTIAKKCGISRSTAIKTVKSLEFKQVISKEIRYNAGCNQNYSNMYIVKHDLGGGVTETPGGVCYTLGSVCETPYKELFKEEQYNKNKRYIALPCNDSYYLTIYNDYFYKKFLKNHMQILEIEKDRILSIMRDLENDDTIPENDYRKAVREHFDTLPTNNNGSVLAFIPTLMRRLNFEHYRY